MQMPRNIFVGLGLLLSAVFSSPVFGDPLRLTASYFIGLEGVNWPTVAAGIDPSQAYQASIGSEHLPRQMTDFGPPYGFDYAQHTMPINSNFTFELGMADPSKAQPSFLGPWLLIAGHVQGSVIGPAHQSHMNGGFSGVASSVSIIGDPPGVPVPQALLDLAHHPERVHISGIVTGGALNLLQTQLEISPPVLAPEPSTVAVFVVVLAGTALRCRRSGAR
jgi:hypothetical protein